MCWKRKPIIWDHYPKVALLFGINDYPGGQNDLNGCLNDLDTVKKMLPDFQIREFRDSEVTRRNFKEQMIYALANAVSGDVIYLHYSGHGSNIPDTNGDELDGYDETLYLYDGNLVDDETSEILKGVPEGVVFVMGLDSCYSGTATRDKGVIRFMPPKKWHPAHVRIKRAIKSSQDYIVISGCAENQTSADAFINGKFNGAFTFYAFSCLSRAYTYRQWFQQIAMRLPNKNFNQSPTLEGPDYLLDRLVFQ